jgi:hypothetical protein
VYKTRDVDVVVMLNEAEHFQATDTSYVAIKAAIALATYRQYFFSGSPSILNLVGNTGIVPTTKALTVGHISNAIDTLDEVYTVTTTAWTNVPTIGTLLVEEFLTGASNRLYTRIETILRQAYGQAFQAAVLASTAGTYPNVPVTWVNLTDSDGNLSAFGDGSGTVTAQSMTLTKTEWLTKIRKAFLKLAKFGGTSSYQ